MPVPDKEASVCACWTAWKFRMREFPDLQLGAPDKEELNRQQLPCLIVPIYRIRRIQPFLISAMLYRQRMFHCDSYRVLQIPDAISSLKWSHRVER